MVNTCANFIKYENLKCTFYGLFIYKDLKAGSDSIHHLLIDYLDDKIDFNQTWGSYRIIIEYEGKEQKLLFGDNTGSCLFFIDYETLDFSNNFIPLVNKKNKAEPNFHGIAQFMKYSCTYGTQTICKNIEKTDATMYYIIDNKGITSYSKNLLPFEQLHKFQSLNAFINHIIKAIPDEKIAAIITGGNDSRTVLANLISNKVFPTLVISGDPNHTDVKIGNKIAEALGLKIYATDIIPKEAQWIQKGFIASDGQLGTFSRYRLLNNIETIKTLGCTVEFGGVGGELYKNSFINYTFPFYRLLKINLSKFLRYKVPASSFKTDLLSEDIQQSLNDDKAKLIQFFSGFIEKNRSKCQNLNEIGFFIMKNRISTLTNAQSNFVSLLSPLMERDVVALAFSKNPWKMEMQMFQRKEVHANCPKIENIKTDRGLTCNPSTLSLFKEYLTSTLFLLKVWLSRRKKNQINKTVEPCLILGLKSYEFKIAFETCKAIGVLKADVDIKDIDYATADKLTTIGLVFNTNISHE